MRAARRRRLARCGRHRAGRFISIPFAFAASAARERAGSPGVHVAAAAAIDEVNLNSIIAFDSAEAGRRLGHDLFRYRRTLQSGRAPASVIEGFTEARQRHVPTCLPDRHVRKWLQLRLSAQQRGRVVADDVTPELLARIDVATCPVLRVTLTHGELQATDGSVDRLNNDAAYAPNNLAVMSTGANRAKGDRSFAEVWHLARADGPVAGLTPVEWSRLAALMLGPCFATRPGDAPLIPLNVPVPLHSARPAVQQIQHVFTTRAGRPAGKNLLIKSFRTACRSERSKVRLGALAERIHLGLKRVGVPCDVWLEPGVMEGFSAWRESLDSSEWAMAAEVSRVLAGSRVVAPSRLSAWHLGTRGYAA